MFPDFYILGRGACAKLPNERKDDFTEEALVGWGVLARERAKAVCASCPFSVECRALGEGEEWTGVYGGVQLRGGIEIQERRVSDNARRKAAARAA